MESNTANNTPTRITDEDLKRLEELDANAAPAPWSVDYMYGAIRHVQRNVDLEAFCDPSDIKDTEHTPGRYDGTFLGELRNMLPGLLARLKAAENVIQAKCNCSSLGDSYTGKRCPEMDAQTAWRKAKGEL